MALTDSEDEAPDMMEGTMRWPEHLRMQMVRAYLGGLSWEQAEAVFLGTAPTPKVPASKLKAIYDELEDKITHALASARETAGQPPAAAPTRRAIQEAAKKWTRAFIERGSIKDLPPHEKGWRLKKNYEALAKLRALLMRGWLDDNGDVHVYRSLDDLRARTGEQFEELYSQTGLKTLEGLWKQLKRAFPKLNKVKLRLKKQRNHVLVQVCAS